jgi:hypothetical protein
MNNLRRIQIVSRGFRLFFLVLLCCAPFGYALEWIFFNQMPPGFQMLLLPIVVAHTEFSLKLRVIGFLLSCLPMSVDLFCTLTLFRLFRLYETGKIFTDINVRCYRRLGYALILWVIAGVLSGLLFSGLIVLADSSGGQGTIVDWVGIVGWGMAYLSTFLIGWVILMISWVMDEGRQLEEDQALTI